MQPFEKKFRIVHGRAFDSTRFVLVLMLDEYADDPDHPHSTVWLVEGDRTHNLAKHIYNVVSATFGTDWSEGVYSLGQWGEIAHYQNGEVVEEELPVSRGPMKCITRIEDSLVAVGAGSHAFIRRRGTWEDISPPESLREDYPLNILESVAGHSADEIYAAGSDGTIWYYNGTVWEVIQCATNLAFYAVTCAADGTVWLTGQAGILAKGRYEAFDVLYADADTMDMWGVAEHQGVVRAAGYTVLVKYEHDTWVVDLEPSQMARHFYDLQSIDGVLWSFAVKDVLRLGPTGWDVIEEVEPQT